MGDSELEAIRARRMAELQQQMGGGQGQAEKLRKEEENKQREDEMKNALLSQILDQSARARLNSIALVKPQKAKMVESMVIQMAQTGQIGGKIGEEQLKSLLEQISEKTSKTTKVKFDRRRVMDSDDDDY